MKHTIIILALLGLANASAFITSVGPAPLPEPPAPPAITWGAANVGTSYSQLADVDSEVTLWQPPEANNGAYNHHPILDQDASGRVWLMFSTGQKDEDAYGQYSRFTYSDDDGATWASLAVCHPGLEALAGASTGTSRAIIPTAWVTLDAVRYAIADVHDVTWSGSSSQSARVGVGWLAVPFTGTTPGTPFWVWPSDPVEPREGYTDYAYDADLGPRIFAQLLGRNCPWARDNPGAFGYFAADGGGLLIEHTTFAAPDGGLIKLMRDNSGGATTYLKAKASRDGYTWSEQATTAIPNSPSKPCLIRLSDGTYALSLNVQNNPTNREPLAIAFSATPFAWQSDNTYKLVGGYSGSPVYSGYAKNGGASYVDLLELSSGRMMAAYSIAKEDIKTVVFDVPTIN